MEFRLSASLLLGALKRIGSSSFNCLKVFVSYMKLWNILWTDHDFLSYLALVTFEQCLEHFPVLAPSIWQAVLGQTISLVILCG